MANVINRNRVKRTKRRSIEESSIRLDVLTSASFQSWRSVSFYNSKDIEETILPADKEPVILSIKI